MSKPLTEQRIAVVGLGLSGLASVRFLFAHGIRPVLMDTRAQPAGLEQINPDKVDGIYLGELDANRLARMDMVILSPGLSPQHPALRFAAAQGVEIIGDVELFARFNRRKVIAITGSNGKSTVTTLVADMLVRSGVKAIAAGNIGLPVLDAIQDNETEVFVLELSSFQLDTTSSLRSVASTILNVSADHLDRYADMAAYARSKQRVYQQTGLAIYNRDDAATLPAAHQQYTAAVSLSSDEYGLVMHQQQLWLKVNGKPLLPVSQMKLFGAHNQFNAIVSVLLAQAAGANEQGILESLRTFTGLPHRCTLVAEGKGIRWVNDSKATNIGATLAAIAGLRPGITGRLILIAGGDGKGADMAELQPVLQRDVQQLITLGKDGPAIAALLPDSIQVASLADAVKAAASVARDGDMVLLSPACASLDMFKSYAERGEQFAQLAQQEVL